MLGDHEIGSSKTDFDARFHMHAINDALDVAYLEGQKYLERLVEERRIQSELDVLQFQIRAENEIVRQQISGPKCKNCGAFTTYTRVNTHGLCMKCENESKS